MLCKSHRIWILETFSPIANSLDNLNFEIEHFAKKKKKKIHHLSLNSRRNELLKGEEEFKN